MTLTLAKPNAASDQRTEYDNAARALFEQARRVAETGQYSEAGSLILKALAQERRAQSTGPQVMQLIKPRS